MKDDLIRRQAAITAIQKAYAVTVGGADRCAVWKNVGLTNALHIMQDLPSAQPERLTDDDFETIRIHLNAYKENLGNQHRWEEAEEYQRIIDRFMAFASAQPEIIRCKDCKWCEDADGLMCKNPASWVVATDFDFGCVCAERRQDE